MLPPELKSRAMQKAKKMGVSLGEIIREALESHLRESEKTGKDDPLFRDSEIFRGDVPKDLSINHDSYLYGEEN
jgi:hypothetical protein